MVLRTAPAPVRSSTFSVGDFVILKRPTDDKSHESPGWNPILDRHRGTCLVVRDVAQGDGYQLVLVHETALPIRGDWLTHA